MAKTSRSVTRVALVAFTCAAVVALGALRAVYGLWRVPQRGMYPGITERSHLVGRRNLFWHANDLRRGDVVIFRTEKDGATYDFVWRIVGLPRDTIAIHNDIIELNGSSIAQHHIATAGDVDIREEALDGTIYRVAIDADRSAEHEFPTTVVPEGSFFLLGDNRQAAYDSRNTGPVPLSAIIARVTSVFEL